MNKGEGSMKKILTVIFLVFVAVMFAACNNNNNPKNGNQDDIGDQPDDENEQEEEFVPIQKHFILDENGNYGGSINEELYGRGAPLNGEYDILNSEYYIVNDFYNMLSTTTRTIFTHFAPYQQRMADSSGLAVALMILNHLGEDVYNQYNELELLRLYEQLNNTTVYGNGTEPEGLVKLFKHIGYEAKANIFQPKGSTTAEQIAYFNSWIEEQLKEGRYVMVRYQDTRSFSWNVIIGYDSMGIDYERNSVLIMADPYDIADHYQDGYKVSPSGRFYQWWRNVDLAGNSTNLYDCVVVYPKTKPFIFRVEDNKTIVQKVPERHLILNPDGTFGGTRNAALYGSVAPGGDALDFLYSTYYKFNDYYNMQSTETRSILPKYMAYQQTMASSCGISSVLSVLHYYGESRNICDEVFLVNKYEELNNAIIYNVGVGATGLKKLLSNLGYQAEGGSYSRDKYVNINSRLFPTYTDFLSWTIRNLRDGTPIPVSWRPHGGHWVVIIGIDTMGTNNVYDDVIIFADSNDTFDHYRDGYVTMPAMLFYRQWYNGSLTYNQQHVIFKRK